MRTSFLSSLIFCVLLGPAAAQETGLELIPSSAAVIVRLQAMETVTADLKVFVNKVQPGFGDIAAAQLSPVLGRATSNTTLAGFDQTRDWYLILLINQSQKAQRVLLIPTTSIAEAKEAMGPSFRFVEKDTWLACCKDEESHRTIESCFQGTSESIAAVFDAHSASMLTGGHLGIAVNAVVLKEVYAEELGSAEGRLEDLIQGMGRQIQATNPTMEISYVFDIYRDIGRALLQSVKDSRFGVMSMRLTESELQIDKVLNVESGSRTDRFFQSHPDSTMERLSTLPESLVGYVGIHMNPDRLFDWSERIMSSMFKDETLKERMAKSIAILRQAEFGTIVAGGDLLPDEESALRYFGKTEIQPGSIMREVFQQFGSEIEYEIAGIQQKQSFIMNAETIEDQSIDIYRLEQTIPPDLDPTGMQQAINEKMYGPEGIVQRIAVQEDLMLQTMGGGSDSMKMLLSADKWSNPLLLNARASLHERANLLILVDMPNMMQKFAKLILGTGVVPIPVEPEQLDNLVIASSYSGYSVALEKERLTVRVRVPAETFQGFVKIGMFVRPLRVQAR